MQISSTNAGFASNPGLSLARRPAVELSVNAHVDVSSTANTRALQRIAPPIALTNTSMNADASSRTLILARQREGLEGLSGNVQLRNAHVITWV